MKRFVLGIALIGLAVPTFAGNTKSEIVLAGKPHMEFERPRRTRPCGYTCGRERS